MRSNPTITDPTTWALDREIVLVRVLDATREAAFAALNRLGSILPMVRPRRVLVHSPGDGCAPRWPGAIRHDLW